MQLETTNQIHVIGVYLGINSAYCFGRWYKGNFEVLLVKDSHNKEFILREAQTLGKIFDAEIIIENDN